MNWNFYKLCSFALIVVLAQISQAQENRYLSPIFSAVDVQKDMVYGNNISILTGAPAPIDLLMDIYSPAGDTMANRPVWIILHTGTFLPPLFNQQVTGARSDSTVVNVCKRLAAMGYVAIAATNRQGWIATSIDDDIRIGSLLQAAYRGMQDTRTCIRFLRKSVAEDNNPFGIDGDKIGVWGIGTGGYLALGAATLDDPEEVELPKFLNSATFTSLADTALLGNFDGTSAGQISLPNHVGYSSDFSICVNLGGALADASWLDGKPNEPSFVGFHTITDRLAPFGTSDVTEPVLGLVLFPNASGARIAIDSANSKGNNDVFNGIPSELDPLNAKIQAFKDVDVIPALPTDTIKAGTDHFYPFFTSGAEGSPWDWWSLTDLQQVVAGTNAALGTDFNADSLHLDGLETNPDMSAEKGNRYLDTIFMVVTPRAYYAFGLDSTSTSIPDLTKYEVGLSLAPNPSQGLVEVNTAIDSPMHRIIIRDISGRVMLIQNRIQTNYLRLNHTDITPGLYFMEIHFEKGKVTEKVVFN